MKAYTMGITKKQFVAETIKHQKADAFVRGNYGQLYNGEFKGCAVGCAIKSINNLNNIDLDFKNHAEYEKHLGIPEWLAKLEDTIFENVTIERSKTWPVEFAQAINQGSELDKIKASFIIYLMEENIKSIDACVYDADKFPDVKKAIDMTRDALNQTIEAQKSGDKNLILAAWSAARSAWSAAESARSAAWSAAWSAAESAWSAARSAAESAWSAAESAESAARSAAESAWSAARSAAESAWSAAESAAESAWSAAESAAFEKHADKLLELMRDCHD